MAKEFDGIVPHVREFIQAQRMYFVGTCPLANDGSVNLSPKGLDTLRVTGAHELVYQDLTGSGNETAAHLLENGRITVMFCSFDERPLIIRVYGSGRVVNADSEEGMSLATMFSEAVGIRGYVVISVNRVRSSCGFGVPFAPEPLRDRDLLARWAQRKGEGGLQKYREIWNGCSIDGLPTK